MQSHCGLCSALATVFRRLMCIAPSRRHSHESYYNETAQHGSNQASNDTSDPCAELLKSDTGKQEEKLEDGKEETTVSTTARSTEMDDTVTNTTADVRVAVVIAEPAPSGRGRKASSLVKRRTLTDSEVVLIGAAGGVDPSNRAIGRFLTMHKRRRRRLATRTLYQCPALLDDLLHGNVQRVLDRVWRWPFNAFTLDTAAGGRSLPVLCVHLFHCYGLTEYFKLDVVRVWKFFSLVEEGYHSTNPYHNAIHATDVTQAMHCFLQEDKIRQYLSPLEILAALIAAVTHDLDHPGVNQQFLTATSNHLAALYQNTSVLENHHWRSAIGCLLESHLAEELAPFRPQLEHQIASLILATDITRQQEFLSRFKNFLDTGTLDMRRAEDRHFVLQISLKCADISNPCRPWDISMKWSLKVCEEFFRQGDYERQLNLPVTGVCDRHSTSVPKIQTAFFKCVVEPLYNEWHRFLSTSLSSSLITHLKNNLARWEALIEKEKAEATRTEISEVDEGQDDQRTASATSDEMTTVGESIPTLTTSPPPAGSGSHPQQRRLSLLTVPSLHASGSDRRRHSVPAALCTANGGNRNDEPRRESLPDPRRRFTLGPMLDEDDELSIVSSCSSIRSKSGSYTEERPVSSEALLPDCSIASMTSSGDAQRISNILQGNFPLAGSSSFTHHSGGSGRLTRQQTFPPVAPPARQRYLSSAGEYRGSTSSESSNGAGAACSGDTSPRCCSDTKPLILKEKENVDPAAEAIKLSKRPLSHSLWKRRGSAPVGLPSPAEAVAAALWSGRRGSVPADMSSKDEDTKRKRRGKKTLKRRSSGGPETFRQKDSTSSRRRGSLPIEALTSSPSCCSDKQPYCPSGRNIRDTMRH